MSGERRDTLADLLMAAAASESGKKKTLEERERETTLELQKDFAGWTRKIVNRWIVGLVVFFAILAIYQIIWEICCVGFNHCPENSYLLFSNWVLITLLGASTATIVGLPLVVIKGLFSSDKNKRQE